MQAMPLWLALLAIGTVLRMSHCFKFDFENGTLVGWRLDKTFGEAFARQPVYGDNPMARGEQAANPQGNWSISTYENRSGPGENAAIYQGNSVEGKIESPLFNITGDCLSFLIGGGCDPDSIKVSLAIGRPEEQEEDVPLGTGNCSHSMKRRTFNTSAYKGKSASVVLQDLNDTDPWGHLSFDDLTDDPKYCERKLETTRISIPTTSPTAAPRPSSPKTLIANFIRKIEQMDSTNQSSLQDAFDLTMQLVEDLRASTEDKEEANFLVTIRPLENFCTEYAEQHLKENQTARLEGNSACWTMGKIPAETEDATINFSGSREAFVERIPDQVSLPKALFRNQSRVFAGFSFRDAHDILPKEYHGMIDLKLTETVMNSPIVAVALKPEPSGILEGNATLVFDNLKEPKESDQLRCVFWNFTLETRMNGSWSRAGCSLKHKTATQTVCSCNHLTSFAVLLQTGDTKLSDEDEMALKIVTYIGCGLSLFGEVLTIVAYLALAKFEEVHTKTHLRINLAVSLALAQITFLSGVESAKGNEGACVFVAVFMHYLFLVAFDWMLLEGLCLYLMVVKVFNVVTRMSFFYVFAWGFPVLVVLTSTVIASASEGGISSYLRRDNFCWISFSNNLIWTFVAPVLFVCLVNTIILGLVVREMKKLQNVGGENISNLRLASKMLVVLFPLLGLTWVFGVLTVTDAGVAFQYLFTILNSLQGFFIFVIHVVRSSEIREAFWKQKQRLQTKKESSLPSNNVAAQSKGRGLSRSVSPHDSPGSHRNNTQSSQV